MPQASKIQQLSNFISRELRSHPQEIDWATGKEHLLFWNNIGFLMLVVMVNTLSFSPINAVGYVPAELKM